MDLQRGALAALVSASVVSPGSAVAADPQPIASATASCVRTDSSYADNSAVFPAQGQSYPMSLLRATIDSSTGGGSAYFRDGSYGESVRLPGEVGWGVVSDVTAGSTLSAAVFCPSGSSSVAASYDWMTVPTVPASFAGVARPNGYSEVAVSVPQDGQYRLSVAVGQGSVRVRSFSGSEFTVVSSASRDLTLRRGLERISVAGLDGPPARWSLGVVALPVAVSDLTIAPRAAKQGAVLTIEYEVSGQATVGARVLGPDAQLQGPFGQLVRSLADGLDVSAGERSLRWDGIDAQGREVPSGVYTVELTVSDVTGNPPQVRTAQVMLDNTPPVLTLPTKRKIGRKRAVVAKVSDPLVGLKEAYLSVNGRRVARPDPDGSMIYRPVDGWTRKARLRVVVTATDRLGNTSSQSKILKVR